MSEKRKLLLADDSITIQKVINLTFADEGIEVTAVGNGSLAIERLSEVAPDLVLADIHMPGLSGYEVCERIRNTPEFKDVPVMLLVGSFEPFDEAEAQRVGANDFLTKPFQSIKQLVSKVNALLESSQKVQSPETIASETETATGFGQTSEPDNEMSLAFDEGDRASSDAAQQAPENRFSFGSASFDDDLIETSPGTSFNQSQDVFEPADERRTAPLSFSDVQEAEPFETDWQVAQTAPLETPTSDPDVFEIDADVLESESPVESHEPYLAETPRSTDETDDSEFVDTVGFESPLRASDEAEEAYFTPERNFETQAPDAVESTTDYATEAEETTSESSLTEEIRPHVTRILDDDDFLLDIGLDEEPAADQTEQESSQSPHAESPEIAGQDENQSQEIARINAPTSLEKTSDATNLSAMHFSPEVIDAIAQRVVEKLSDKVIEKIAWEIVPDRFDLIVRKQMHDKDRDR